MLKADPPSKKEKQKCPLAQMSGIESCSQCTGNSLAWLLYLWPFSSREGGRRKREGIKINKFSVSKVTATFKIIRQIHLFHKCLHFQMPLFGPLCCHCPWHFRKLGSSSFRCSWSSAARAKWKDYTFTPLLWLGRWTLTALSCGWRREAGSGGRGLEKDKA